MAYDYASIEIEGIKVEHINSISVVAQEGEHTTLTLSALIRDENVIHKITEESPIKVKLNGKEKKLIFDGIITHTKINVNNGVYEVIITGKSNTYLMDIEKHSRSFQNINMTYHKLIKEVMKSYKGADCIIEIENKPTGEMIVQYEETDWEFIKRIISTFNEGVFPAGDVEGIKFYAGVPEIAPKDFKIKEWDLERELDGYYKREAETKGSAKGVNYTVFKVKSYDFIGVGNNIKIKEQKLYIRRYEITIEKGLVVVNYEAQKRAGIRKRKEFPMKILGAALGGKIIETNGVDVKVWLDIDKQQSAAEACIMKFATNATTKDGSGWYCMPEKGDLVRVYFPTKYTKDIIAISAVSDYPEPGGLSGEFSGTSGTANSPSGSMGNSSPSTTAPSSGGGKDRMGDPNVLSISNVAGKEVNLSPAGINMYSGGGTINLSSSGDLTISANKKVDVKAEEGLEVKADMACSLNALEKIELTCDKGAKVILHQNVYFKGTEVMMD